MYHYTHDLLNVSLSPSFIPVLTFNFNRILWRSTPLKTVSVTPYGAGARLGVPGHGWARGRSVTSSYARRRGPYFSLRKKISAFAEQSCVLRMYCPNKLWTHWTIRQRSFPFEPDARILCYFTARNISQYMDLPRTPQPFFVLVLHLLPILFHCIWDSEPSKLIDFIRQ